MPKMPKISDRARFSAKRKLCFFICFALITAIMLQPSFAGGLSDIAYSVFAFFIKAFLSLLLGVASGLATFFLNVLSVDIDTLRSAGFLSGFESAKDFIRSVAVAIASLLFLWQLFGVLFGPFINIQQGQSIMSIIMRTVIFIPLTYWIQDLALEVLNKTQSVYSTSLDIDIMGTIGRFDMDQIGNTLGLDAESGKSLLSNANDIPDGIYSLMAMIVGVLLIFAIMVNVIKLLFEIAQRFASLVFYAYMSPLAVACGVGANAINIAKTSLTLFISTCVLWVLSAWSVSVCLDLFALGPDVLSGSAEGGAASFFLWGMFTYGCLKIAQQLDDIFNAVGATNVRMSGSLLGDLMSVKTAAGLAIGAGKAGVGIGKAAMHGMAALEKFAQNGMFKGNSPSNPVTPKGTSLPNGGHSPGAASSKGSTSRTTSSSYSASRATASGSAKKPTASANGMSVPNGGQKKPMTAQAAASKVGRAALSATGNIAKHTAVGQIARGVAKTGQNVASRAGVAVSAMESRQAQSQMYDALSHPSSKGRADALKSMAQTNPSAFKDQGVKDYVGANMGLYDNQSVASLSVDKAGDMSAMVATKNDDGTVTMSKVSGITDMSFGDKANHSAITGGAEASMPAKSGAGISYTGFDGATHQAIVSSSGESSYYDNNNRHMQNFSVSSDNNSKPVSVQAPVSMTEAEVGALVAGTASAEVHQKFEAGGGSYTSITGATSAIALDAKAGTPTVSDSVAPVRSYGTQQQHYDGTTWETQFNASVSDSGMGEQYPAISFATGNNVGAFAADNNAGASGTAFASSESAFIRPTGNKTASGMVEYEYGQGDTSFDTIKVDASASTADIVAALHTAGTGNGSVLSREDISRLRTELGITSFGFSESESVSLENFLKQAAADCTSKDKPKQPTKKIEPQK